jgi:hypothetical protein
MKRVLPGFHEAASIVQAGERVVVRSLVLVFELLIERTRGGKEEDGEAGEREVARNGERGHLLDQVGEKEGPRSRGRLRVRRTGVDEQADWWSPG